MKTKKTFYVTTPIYYVNAPPHIGHTYTTIAADILARWNHLQGKEIFFLTGTDEHGRKIQDIAKRAGKAPKKFVDEIAQTFKDAWKKTNINYTNFIRTTDPEHEKEVKKILQELYKKKFIYKGHYKSYYCVGCEQYLTRSDLVNGRCPNHDAEPEIKKEEAYLFKLSAFEKQLLKLIKTNKLRILPEKRKNEMLAFIKSGLQDISISRKKSEVSWGIELPFDKNHTCYVWVDAFWNYYTGLREDKTRAKFWPPDIQLMANDILRVHATIWPAILLALKKKLPEKLFVHGYFVFGGQKMSKSLGNIMDPVSLSEKVGADSLRYFIFRNIPFGEDGDFSEKSLISRHNTELADKLGNLVSRISTLAERFGLEKTKTLDSKKLVKSVERYFENLEFDKALTEIFSFIDTCNELIQKNKPWETKDKKLVYQISNAIKDITILISPFMPETAEKISQIFNFELSLKALSKPIEVTKIKKAPILFKKIDLQEQEKVNKPEMPAGIMTMEKAVDFKDWEKLDLRVAKIKKVEDIKDADKLYKLTLDVGELGRRIVCAGIKEHYAKDKLKDKRIIYFANLKPRTMRGIESQGMILAAVSKDHSKVILITPEKEIKEGSRVS